MAQLRDLPMELLTSVARYTQPKDLLALRAASRRCRIATKDSFAKTFYTVINVSLDHRGITRQSDITRHDHGAFVPYITQIRIGTGIFNDEQELKKTKFMYATGRIIPLLSLCLNRLTACTGLTFVFELIHSENRSWLEMFMHGYEALDIDRADFVLATTFWLALNAATASTMQLQSIKCEQDPAEYVGLPLAALQHEMIPPLEPLRYLNIQHLELHINAHDIVDHAASGCRPFLGLLRVTPRLLKVTIGHTGGHRIDDRTVRSLIEVFTELRGIEDFTLCEPHGTLNIADLVKVKENNKGRLKSIRLTNLMIYSDHLRRFATLLEQLVSENPQLVSVNLGQHCFDHISAHRVAYTMNFDIEDQLNGAAGTLLGTAISDMRGWADLVGL